MKRVRILLLLLLCGLLLTGCDLRNRKNSEQYISDVTWNPETQRPAVQTDPIGIDSGMDAPDNPYTDSRIRLILNASGVYEYTAEPVAYSYQIPMLDLSGAQAAGCNQEIEERFGAPTRASLEAMEQRSRPEVAVVSFESYEHGGILTLRLDRRDVDGSSYQAYYSVNASDGERVTVQDFLRAAGLGESKLPDLVIEALQRRYAQEYRDAAPSEESYTAGLTETLAQASGIDGSYLHLTREGRLVAAAELIAPSGSREWIELPLS